MPAVCKIETLLAQEDNFSWLELTRNVSLGSPKDDTDKPRREEHGFDKNDGHFLRPRLLASWMLTESTMTNAGQ